MRTLTPYPSPASRAREACRRHVMRALTPPLCRFAGEGSM